MRSEHSPIEVVAAALNYPLCSPRVKSAFESVEIALEWYAERRNWHDFEGRDAYDGEGPGARARGALERPDPYLAMGVSNQESRGE